MLFVITNSYDVTTDLLIRELNGTPIFRFNFDHFADYRFRWGRRGFDITDPAGRRADSGTIAKAYWRKPFQGETSECSNYQEIELRYILREMVNLLWSEQKFTLVEPFAEKRIGKLLQLQYASTYFDVPSHEVVLNQHSDLGGSLVVKSLSGHLNEGKALFTTQVQTDALDYRYPWFIQEYVLATHDVTAVFVAGQVFGFALRRDFLHHAVDWREISLEKQAWQPHILPGPTAHSVCGYMRHLRLDYGRLDFLLDHEGRYWFCEVNPNGQFAWLDLDRQFGLLDSVLDAISPNTPHVPLSNPHPLQFSRLPGELAHDTD
jgi:hypothetical protein